MESANIKLASVATDVLGVSGRRMLTALIAGEEEPAAMAELAKGRLRSKIPQLEQALTGLVDDHHRYLLDKQLRHVDFLDEEISELEREIGYRLVIYDARDAERNSPQDDETQLPSSDEEETGTHLSWQQAVQLLDSAPGVNPRAAQSILAEIGCDMSQFPSANHLAAWTGLSPGNHQSGNKHHSTRTRKGNRTMRTLMVQVAWAAVRTRGTYVKSLYHRLAARRGKKRAIVAVAHSLVVSFYHMLSHNQPYQDLGADYFDKRRKGAKLDWHLKQLAKLGYRASVELLPPEPLPA